MAEEKNVIESQNDGNKECYGLMDTFSVAFTSLGQQTHRNSSNPDDWYGGM